MEIARTQYISTLAIWEKVMNLEVEEMQAWGNVNCDGINNEIHSIQV